MQDTRFVYIFDLSDQPWVDSFKNIISSEEKILNILDRTDYPLIENEDVVFDEAGNMVLAKNENLPEETNEYIDYKISLLKDNYYYNRILYYRHFYEFSFRISEYMVRNYGDVIQINSAFINDKYKERHNNLIKYTAIKEPYDVTERCFIISDDDQFYYGNVWTFTRSKYPFIGMYGIKRSMLDIITKHQNNVFKGISKLLINKIKEFALSNNIKKIIVANPLEGMLPILEKYGFIRHEDEGESIEKSFLKPITGAYTYYTYDI